LTPLRPLTSFAGGTRPPNGSQLFWKE
jgi:hypothetical protein